MARSYLQERGTQGLNAVSGYIQEAYNTKLMWPTCYDDYNRIRRSDPEMTMVRNGFTTMARLTSLDCELPDDANDDEKRFQEFTRQALEDFDGGTTQLLEAIVNYVPFLGWAWWEVVPGKRKAGWTKDGWQSQFNDGLTGIRKLAWRDHSSFYKWEMDDETGHVSGMWQRDPPRPAVLLPLEECLHLTFGDPYNPEGLALLEAVWRLEYIKRGFEQVMGIGFEHAAGYLDVKSESKLDAADKQLISQAARAILTAQEGNYALWPKGVTGEVKDTSFTAGADLLEVIRYYGLMKLQVFAMEFVSVATTAGGGAYSARDSGRESAIDSFNGMLEGMAEQIDKQIGERLYRWNKESFPGIVRRPRIVALPVEKSIALDQLGAFLTAISPIVPMDDEDMIAIRRKSGFLPENLPESEEVKQAEPGDKAEPEAPAEPEPDEGREDVPDAVEGAEMARRPFAVGDNEQPEPGIYEADVTRADIDRAVRRFGNWARVNDPMLWGLMNAKVGEVEE